MKFVDANLNQETLDSLRMMRRKLFAISELDLNALSLDDQVKYADSLHQTSLAILKLEAAKLKGVNDQFKTNEEALKNAAVQLESDTATLSDVTKVIRVANEGIILVTNTIKMLA